MIPVLWLHLLLDNLKHFHSLLVRGTPLPILLAFFPKGNPVCSYILPTTYLSEFVFHFVYALVTKW